VAGGIYLSGEALEIGSWKLEIGNFKFEIYNLHFTIAHGS
jgi:hypothetical protein